MALTIVDNMQELLSKILSICPKFGRRLIKIFGIKFTHRNKLYLSKYIKAKESNENITTLPKADGVLRDVQLANLKILKNFAAVCKAQNLEYWLFAGTLLGAIRHKGYIPWDDDIDVCMMREDCLKLLKIFNEVSTDKNLYIKTLYNKHTPGMLLIKILHKNFPFLFIDIFPCDFYHSKLAPEQQAIVNKKIIEHRKLINQDKSLLKLSREKCYDYLMDYTKKNILDNKISNPESEPDIFLPLDFPHGARIRICSYNDIFPTNEVFFENCMLKQVNKPEKIAENIFGKDYMNYPPKIELGHCSNVIISPKEHKLLKEYIKSELTD